MNIDLYGMLLQAFAILLGASIIVPLIASKRKLAGWINTIAVAIAAGLLMYVAYMAIFVQQAAETQAIYFGSVPVYFLIDAFSGFFIAIISFMAVMSALYSIDYMEHYKDYSLVPYYINFPLFILGMIGIVTVDDLSIGFTVAWQLMTIASYFLIRFEYKEKQNVRNANKYLILMELAWLFIVVGAFLINGSAMGDSIHTLTQKLGTSGGMIPVVYALLLLGFSFKAGVFPFGQLWLPDAHSIAPSPVSALLSGVMIKTGIYGIVRTFFWMIPHEGHTVNPLVWGSIIATFGVVTLFIGTSQSLKQSDAKRLLAYSSIGQIGYIVLAIGAGLYMYHSSNMFVQMLSFLVIIGMLYHVLNHAIFKGLLFLTAGSILYETGTKDLNKLGGLLKFMPVSAVIAGIASLSIAGVPPFSGFASKWTIISATLLGGSQVFFLALFGIIALFTSALTLACYVKFFGMSFASTGVEWNVEHKPQEVSWKMLVPKIILGLLCIVQGIVPFIYYETIMNIFRSSTGSIVQNSFNELSAHNAVFTNALGVTINVPGMQYANAIAVPLVVIVIVIIGFAVAYMLKKSAGSQEKVMPTWLCGYQDLNNNNRYKDRHMFAALKSMLWWTGGNVK
ncbi:MAG TPA: proton-conducting transporter membrane subunit [Spirochaetota bacterium]|nr:proton-conducting transporter membrane subunit [Spirochaetota bacterium]